METVFVSVGDGKAREELPAQAAVVARKRLRERKGLMDAENSHRFRKSKVAVLD